MDVTSPILVNVFWYFLFNPGIETLWMELLFKSHLFIDSVKEFETNIAAIISAVMA